MSGQQPEFVNFGSSEKLLTYVKERSDDIERVVIPLSPKWLGDKLGNPIAPLPSFGMALHMIDGSKKVLTREDAEILLNDGLLNRLRIRIELIS